MHIKCISIYLQFCSQGSYLTALVHSSLIKKSVSTNDSILPLKLRCRRYPYSHGASRKGLMWETYVCEIAADDHALFDETLAMDADVLGTIQRRLPRNAVPCCRLKVLRRCLRHAHGAQVFYVAIDNRCQLIDRSTQTQ